jgi:N-acetyl-anhydromuramyl-L-alanine amidase AmpD
MIDRWHRDRGWNGIGYHYVIINDKHERQEDGTVEEGRRITIRGAHAKGLNRRSIGICCIGHGDMEPFTQRQTESLVQLISNLIDEHEDIVIERIIGHRELNTLVAKGLLSREYATSKSCPGNKVDMDRLRDMVQQHREAFQPVLPSAGPQLPPKEDIKKALILLEQSAADLFPNASGEFKEFITHPEVIAFRS